MGIWVPMFLKIVAMLSTWMVPEGTMDRKLDVVGQTTSDISTCIEIPYSILSSYYIYIYYIHIHIHIHMHIHIHIHIYIYIYICIHISKNTIFFQHITRNFSRFIPLHRDSPQELESIRRLFEEADSEPWMPTGCRLPWPSGPWVPKRGRFLGEP